eukprot:NODE_55_length_26219_cov_0.194908.p11 type:complete len:250 gc:universal NODE_55_length_26219_cov_0.194908:13331-12582(-)
MEFEQIILHRIQQSTYYKEKCFGLNAASLVDRAVKLQYIGGTFGGNQNASEFLCLLHRLTKIKPSIDILMAYINNDSFKYLTALGLFYCRLTMKSVDVYKILEPFYLKYNKLRVRSNSEVSIIYMDEFVDQLLTNDRVCGLILPRISKRAVLEDLNLLPLYLSLVKEDDVQEVDASQDSPEQVPKQDNIRLVNKTSKKGFSKAKLSKLFKTKTVIKTAEKKIYSGHTLEEVNEKRLADGLEPLLELREK